MKIWIAKIIWWIVFAPMSPDDKKVLGYALLQASFQERPLDSVVIQRCGELGKWLRENRELGDEEGS